MSFSMVIYPSAPPAPMRPFLFLAGAPPAPMRPFLFLAVAPTAQHGQAAREQGQAGHGSSRIDLWRLLDVTATIAPIAPIADGSVRACGHTERQHEYP
jgi:hypothetical protein